MRLAAKNGKEANSQRSAFGVQQREQQTRAGRPSSSSVQYGPWWVYMASEGTQEAMLVLQQHAK
jgi:hypothetical protein